MLFSWETPVEHEEESGSVLFSFLFCFVCLFFYQMNPNAPVQIYE